MNSIDVYVSQSIENNISKENIYLKLLNDGYSVADIEQAYLKKHRTNNNQKRTLYIVVLFGAIFIGAGVFSFVASNWNEMSDMLKVVVILSAMLLAYLSGWNLKENRNMPKTGEALLLLGTVMYGAGIFLVAQIYNIKADWPDGFLLWMIGVLGIAYVMNSVQKYVLALFLGFIALFGFLDVALNHNSFSLGPYYTTSNLLLLVSMIVVYFTSQFFYKTNINDTEIALKKKHLFLGFLSKMFISAKDFLSQGYLVLAVSYLGVFLLSIMRDVLTDQMTTMNILFVVFTAGLLLAYVYKSFLNLTLWTAALVSWWFIKAGEYWLDVPGSLIEVKSFTLFLGLTFIALFGYVLGYIHKNNIDFEKKLFPQVFFLLSSTFLLGSIYLFSTKLGISLLDDMLVGQSLFSSTQILISLIAFMGFFLVGIAYVSIKGLMSHMEMYILLLLGIGYNTLLHIPSLDLIGGNWMSLGSLTNSGLLIALIFNVLLFIAAVGIILRGANLGKAWMVNVGTVLLLLIIITKYFDWLFSFLDKSIFFVGAGLLLFGVGYFMERKRRSIIKSIKEVTVDEPNLTNS